MKQVQTEYFCNMCGQERSPTDLTGFTPTFDGLDPCDAKDAEIHICWSCRKTVVSTTAKSLATPAEGSESCG